MQLAAFGEQHRETAGAYVNLGEIHFHLGNLAQAQQLIERGVSIFAAVVGDHRDQFGALFRLETIARQQGEIARANELQRSLHAMAARLGVTLASSTKAPEPVAAAPPPPAAPIDPVVLQQAKESIRQKFAEISQLASSDIRPSVFFTAWLERVITTLGAHGGAIWMIDSLGKPVLEAEWNLPAECQPESPHAATHEYMLRWLPECEHAVVAPGTYLPNAPESHNPTSYLLLMAKMNVPRQGSYVIEIAQRANCPPAAIKGFSSYLNEVCKLLRHYLEHR